MQYETDRVRHGLSGGRSVRFNIGPAGPDRVARLHPSCNLDGVLGVLRRPDDGPADQTNVTMAMATGARAKCLPRNASAETQPAVPAQQNT